MKKVIVKKIPLSEIRELLKEEGAKLTDEEIEQIVDFLYMITLAAMKVSFEE